MGRLHTAKPYFIRRYIRGAFSDGDSHSCSPREDVKPYLKKEFRSNARRFLGEFCSTMLSTVAARSKLGQKVSCFRPEIILRGDVRSAFFLYGQLLDGLVECGGRRGPILRLAKPSSSLLSGSSASWSVIPRGSALLYETSWPTSLSRLDFRVAGTCSG